MGPGGGSDPGNRGGGSGAGGSKGGTGGDGRGNNTPGHPGNPGRRGNSAPGKGATGGPGRDTPGAPGAPDGKRGSTMGPDGGSARSGPDGRGSNTPGSPASRARDAMDRRARNTERTRDRRSMLANEGLVSLDNDAQAGLGITDAMDAQQTENSLNRAGVTDALGMSNADRLGAAVNAGAALSGTERQQAKGIVAGHRNQFTANRVNDIMGLVPGIGQLVGLISEAVADTSRPSNTMESDYSEGRQRANNTELSALGETAVGYGLGKAGISAPMRAVNFSQAIARDVIQNEPITSLRNAGFGSSPAGKISSTLRGGTARSAREAMIRTPPTTSASQPTQFGWSPVNIDNYGEGLLSLAQKTQM